MAKFPLGQLAATPGALEALETSGQTPDILSIHVDHQTSRPSTMFTGSPVRLYTITRLIDGVFVKASSTFFFNGTTVPRR